MTDYAVGIDRGSGMNDSKILGDIVNALKKCSGGSVTSLGVGPNKVQSYGLTSAANGKVGVYITNGVGLATPNDLAQSYYHYSHVIFVWPQYINNQYMSDENIKNHIVKGEHDWNRASSWNVGGQTAAQWFSSNSKVDLVSGKSAEDIAQRICNQAFVTADGNPSSSGSSTGSSTGSSDSGSGTSPLLDGEMTFEDLVGEICNGIDLLFLVKRSTVVVDSFESIYAEAKYLRDKKSDAVKDEDIQLWQLEEDSYELEVNQHGFYNTVLVKYKNGTVEESYDEFVQVYGKIPITYKEPKLDKTSAIMKAKAYLSAHIRDFEMMVNLSMLTNANIDIGDIVTVDNPQNLINQTRISEGLDPEYLFVNGFSTEWEGDTFLQTDLELKFAPTSPKKLEVPSSGTATGSNASSESSNGGASGSFNKCGVSSDGTKLCAIGKPSAVGENSKYGYTLYRSVFVRKCPFCGSDELYWGYMWNGNFPCTKNFNNGSDGRYEGHIYCDGCDADFSCITGADHMSPPRAYLTRADSGPVKATESDANALKSGTYSI